MPDDAKIAKPAPTHAERWRELAEKASKEEDPDKLLEEIERLCDELEQRERLRKPPPSKP